MSMEPYCDLNVRKDITDDTEQNNRSSGDTPLEKSVHEGGNTFFETVID